MRRLGRPAPERAAPEPRPVGAEDGARFPTLPFCLAALALLTAARLAVATLAPLAPDETYYWLWSRTLQPGYLDHPVMVALWIRLGTLIAGQDPLGVRLLGPLSAALGSFLIYRAARDLCPRVPGVGLVAAAFLNATLLFGVGAVIITPDTPLLFFWTLGLFVMGRLIATGKGRWWLAAGIASGLALDSKYTAPLFLAAVGVWLLATPAGRRWLRRPEPWLGLALALLLFAPTIVWNAQHHWVSFAKQGGRVGAWQPADALRFESGLVAGQAGLFTPLVFAAAVFGTWKLARRAWRTGDAAAALLSLLTLIPAALFVEHALGDRVQGNWPGVLYPSAAIAAAALAAPGWKRLRVPAVGLGLALTALVYVQATAAPMALSARLDPTLRELGGWSGLARSLEAAALESGAAFIATPNYGAAAELAFLARGPVPIVAVGPRWRFFRLTSAAPVLAGGAGLLLRPGASEALPDPRAWSTLGRPRAIVRERRGRIAKRYALFRVRARKAPEGVLLPRRRAVHALQPGGSSAAPPG